MKWYGQVSNRLHIDCGWKKESLSLTQYTLLVFAILSILNASVANNSLPMYSSYLKMLQMIPRHSKSLIAGSWMKDACRIRPLVLIFYTINILSVKYVFPSAEQWLLCHRSVFTVSPLSQLVPPPALSGLSLLIITHRQSVCSQKLTCHLIIRPINRSQSINTLQSTSLLLSNSTECREDSHCA